MNLLIDVEVDTPLGRTPSSNLEIDEFTEKQSKILSSRCTRSKKK
jgi:hypothetical protein